MIKEWKINVRQFNGPINYSVVVSASSGRHPFTKLKALVEHFKEVYPADEYHIDVLQRPVAVGTWLDTDNLEYDTIVRACEGASSCE